MVPLVERSTGAKGRVHLEQPAAEKAEVFTCKICLREYGGKKNYGFCSSKCRAAAKKAPLKCDHGRQKSKCKDCGTGHCKHGREKSKCTDCGTGHCAHGRQKSKRKDCGTGRCEHGREKGKCKDCGTGHCAHGRQKSNCRDCGTGHRLRPRAITRAPEEQAQGLWPGPLRARAQEGSAQVVLGTSSPTA
jgi:hypothetical protein